jgi:hypothetical protein
MISLTEILVSWFKLLLGLTPAIFAGKGTAAIGSHQ